MLYIFAKFSAVIPIGVGFGTRSVNAAANESSIFKSTPYLFPNLAGTPDRTSAACGGAK